MTTPQKPHLATSQVAACTGGCWLLRSLQEMHLELHFTEKKKILFGIPKSLVKDKGRHGEVGGSTHGEVGGMPTFPRPDKHTHTCAYTLTMHAHTCVHTQSQCVHTHVHTQYTHTYPCMHMHSHMHMCVCRALAERLPCLRVSMVL